MNVSDEVIRQALALSRARGATLLSLLGNFKVWHGNLGEMRGDSPQTDNGDAPTEPITTTPDHLADVLLMARAMELLDLDCRTALSRAYERRDDIATATANRGPNADAVTSERVQACKSRLVDLYSELQKRSPQQATPEWVAEREHAALAASHGRHRA